MIQRRCYSYVGKILQKIAEETLTMNEKLAATSKTWFPAQVSLIVAGNGNKSACSSLILSADHKSYIFNCGESFQRTMHLTRTKVKTYRNVFITHRSWNNMSGLPGLVMLMDQEIGGLKKRQRLVDPNSDILTIHGPTFAELTSLATTGESKLTLRCELKSEAKVFEDEFLRIEMIPISKKKTNGEETAKRLKSETNYCYAYLAKTKPIPGKLLIKECMDRKVPRGPLLAKLKSGEDITLENGTIVRASDVREPTKPGISFLAVECPSYEYLDSLLDQQAFFQDTESPPSAVVHFSPVEVAICPKYQEWISRFPPDTVHFGINEWNPPLSLFASHIIGKKLRKVDDKIFCEPYFRAEPDEKFQELKILPSRIAQIYRLYPENKRGFDMTYYEEALKELEEGSTKDELFEDDILDPEGLASDIEEYKAKVSALPEATEKYPTITFLGTGSALPSKYRNSSCILVDIDEDTKFMFDCGEGSIGQFYRHYGPRAGEEFKKVKAAFLSHYHADHQIGFMSFALHRKQYTRHPLLLVCSSYVANMIKKFSRECEFIDDQYNHVPSQNAIAGLDSEFDLRRLHLSELRTCRVDHCIDSFGIIIKTSEPGPKKIVYSGDAMPTREFIKAGRDCDLLIHEATFEDALRDEALIKRHSTTSQALDVGKQMNAKFILLTHFSQRYHRMPVIPEKFPSNVGICFDNMKVTFGDFHRLPLVINPLKTLFQDRLLDLERARKLREMKTSFESTEKFLVSLKDKNKKELNKANQSTR